MSNNSTDVIISDLLRLALPLNTEIVAGRGAAKRHVKWVVVLSGWEDLSTQVQEGDLVLMPSNLQRRLTIPHWQQRLARLAEINIAGLLVFDRVPESVLAEAGQHNVPILLAADTITLREANRVISALLVDRQSATSERGLQLYRTLSEMSREDQGLEAMTEVVSKLTNKVIIVQDKRLDVVAIQIPVGNKIELDPLIEAITKREQLPSVLRNRKAAARAHQSYWQQVLPIENVGRLVSPIVSGDRARGYVSIVGPADDLDLMDTLAVEHAAAAFALEMAKAKAVSEAKKSLRGNFLEGLLAGTLPQKEIDRLEGRLDHDTKQPHAILTLSWSNVDAPSLRRLESAVHWVLNNHSRTALVHLYGDKFLCIFQTLKNMEDMDSAYDLGRRIWAEVEREFPDSTLIAGMSGPAQTLSEWPRVYNEALQAMQLGDRLQLGEVVEFSSLGVYKLLGQLEEIPAVREFTNQVIGPLVEYDEKHNSTLVHTMDAYFAHHGNISQTAESLFIHRNTLLYRLERIQDLTRHDLNQSNMRMGLHLALKLWQLRPDK